MNYIILGLGSYLFFIFLNWRSKTFHQLALSSVNLLDTLLSSEEEEVKVKKVQTGTSKLLKYLLFSFVTVGLGLLVIVLPIVFYFNRSAGGVLSEEIFSWQSVLAVSIGSVVAFIFPKFNKSGDYSELSKLLHRLALNHYNLHLKLFKREVKLKQKKGANRNDKFIIITGLARAGTTSLLNKLADFEAFSTLNYANMPFILAPNTWRRFYNPKTGELKERSHKDGIQIGKDSNEALEEYFFKAISNDDFIEENALKEYDLSDEEYQSYLDYQTLIRESNDHIYLAKNNNFLIRHESLRKYNEHFKCVILFREPLFHASSLLAKHEQYSKSQETDPFELEYMDWLGHYEFGLNQKPFRFKEGELIEKDAKSNSSLDFWLKNWINYYSKALSINSANTLFMSYERYSENPGVSMKNLGEFLEIQLPKKEYATFLNSRKVEHAFNEGLVNEAKKIYANLKARSIND